MNSTFQTKNIIHTSPFNLISQIFHHFYLRNDISFSNIFLFLIHFFVFYAIFHAKLQALLFANVQLCYCCFVIQKQNQYLIKLTKLYIIYKSQKIEKLSEMKRTFTQDSFEENTELARKDSCKNQSAHYFRDELEFAVKPTNKIRQKIDQIEQDREIGIERRKRKLEERKDRILNRSTKLSISNDGSALSKIFSSNSRISGISKKIDHYENIANITEAENKNLKEQNEYLLEKIKKMKEKESKFAQILQKAKKYKALYEETLQELEVAMEEREAYKKTSEQMKKIALNDVIRLEGRIYPLLRQEDDERSVESSDFSKNETQKTKEETDGQQQFPAQYL